MRPSRTRLLSGMLSLAALWLIAAAPLAVAADAAAWQPLPAEGMDPGTIRIATRSYPNLAAAARALGDGERLEVGPGVYREALVIRASNVEIVGRGEVVIDGASAEGKAAIVNKGDGNRIVNIACRNITVPDGNGACVRHEGRDLTLEHVYFHDAQQGLLSGSAPGTVKVLDSRFERLGNGGRAHGIYLGGGQLYISHSAFLASRGQGHEIKSRGTLTVIDHSLIASLDGEDSRLIDLPHGGELVVRDSVLEQGPRSANRDMIGFGLEGRLHAAHRIELRDNVIVVDDVRGARLLHIGNGVDIEPVLNGNTVIGDTRDRYAGINLWVRNRAAAGLPAYPALPPVPESE